jgi:beta-phosphoglucomutase-like phosphatase (HAD superfamily)
VQSVCALGNLKGRYFLQHLEQHGVEPCDAAIALVRSLRAQEIRTAVVSSSTNCTAVLGEPLLASVLNVKYIR